MLFPYTGVDNREYHNYVKRAILCRQLAAVPYAIPRKSGKDRKQRIQSNQSS